MFPLVIPLCCTFTSTQWSVHSYILNNEFPQTLPGVRSVWWIFGRSDMANVSWFLLPAWVFEIDTRSLWSQLAEWGIWSPPLSQYFALPLCHDRCVVPCGRWEYSVRKSNAWNPLPVRNGIISRSPHSTISHKHGPVSPLSATTKPVREMGTRKKTSCDIPVVRR